RAVLLGEASRGPAVGDHVLPGRARHRVARVVDLLGHHQVPPVDLRVHGRLLGGERVAVPAVLVAIRVRADAHGVAAGQYVDHDVVGGAAGQIAVGDVDRVLVADARLEVPLDLRR